MSFRFLIFIVALSSLGLGPARAGDKVWVDLYLAENNAPHPQAVLAPPPMHDRLSAVFGFKNYELIKSDPIELAHEWEQWAVPRKDFFIRVEPLHQPEGAPPLVAYELYKDGFVIVKGQYEAQRETPLFINGPAYKQGRFIFVLEER